MLVGFPPFEGDDPLDLYKKIVANQIKWPKKVSATAQECIGGLLNSDPAMRLGSGKHAADDIKKATFFKKIVAWQCAGPPTTALDSLPRVPACPLPTLACRGWQR